MNEICFDIVEANHLWYGATVAIYIDGRSFIELVREIETPFAFSARRKGIAGKYVGLSAIDTLTPNGHFLDSPCRKYTTLGGVMVLMCDCGEPGCWPLACKIKLDGDRIIWWDFQNPHRGINSKSGHWKYDHLGPFVFDLAQYERALRLAAGKWHKIEEAASQAERLSMPLCPDADRVRRDGP